MRKPWIEERRGKRGRRYVVRWRDGSVKKAKSFTLKPYAVKFADRLEEKEMARRAGVPVKPDLADTPPLDVWIQTYLKQYSKANKSQGSVLQDTRALRLLLDYLGPVPVGTVTTRQLLDFYEKMRERYKRNSPRTIMAQVKAAFAYARKVGDIESDPALPIDLPSIIKGGRILFDNEIQAIIDAVDPALVRPIMFALYSGLRFAEQAALDWSMVTIESDGSALLSIRRSAEVGLPGGFDTKTRKPRTVPVKAVAVALMGDPKTSGPVFNMTSYHSAGKLTAAAAKAGLGKVTWHHLRHNWAARRVKETDLWTFLREGGWSSVQSAHNYQHSDYGKATANGLSYSVKLPHTSPTE